MDQQNYHIVTLKNGLRVVAMQLVGEFQRPS